MKTLLFLATILGTLGVHAADRKLGNLILIERDIEDIYANCMKTVSASTKDHRKKEELKKYYFCAVQVTRNPAEVLVNKGTAFFDRGTECQVDSEFANGKLLISFSTEKKKATAEDAKKCLRDTLNSNPDVVATLQTLE